VEKSCLYKNVNNADSHLTVETAEAAATKTTTTTATFSSALTESIKLDLV
jgi:hypothetical protein